jgi:hypothetical protein
VLLLAPGCATLPLRKPSEKDVIGSVLDASVQVVLERDGERYRTGSGVVIGVRPDQTTAGADCLILTSGHTLAGVTEGDANEVYALFDRHRGAGTKTRAHLLARRETTDVDLALLRAPAPHCRATRLGQPPALGDRIWIVGFPWGRQLRLISGIVSEVSLDPRGHRMAGAALMVDASVAYGMSGGGVFDGATGRLVGLIEGYGTARVSFGQQPALQYIDVPVPGETYVTSLDTIDRFLRESGGLDPAR